jgi:hypothetical protein
LSQKFSSACGFGIPIEQIITAGLAEINALQAFIEFSARDTRKVQDETDARLAALTQEIEALKAALELQVSTHQALTKE